MCVCVYVCVCVHVCVNHVFSFYSRYTHRVSRVYIKGENKKAQAEPRKPALLCRPPVTQT